MNRSRFLSRFLLLLVIFGTISFAQLSNGGEIIDSGSKESVQGSTKVRGDYSIEDLGDKIKINLTCKVTKTGQFGVGQGGLVFQLSDHKGELLYRKILNFPVGAKVPEGVASKTESASVTLIGENAKRIKKGSEVQFAVAIDRDNDGMEAFSQELNKIASPAWLIKQIF